MDNDKYKIEGPDWENRRAAINSRMDEIRSFQPIMPNPRALLDALEEGKDADLASGFYKRLNSYIANFEKDLSEMERVGLRLVSFGQSITISVDSLGYHNPSLIAFYGHDTNSGSPCELIQHVSQISFLLIAVPTTEPVTERERIGFKFAQERGKNDSEEKD